MNNDKNLEATEELEAIEDELVKEKSEDKRRRQELNERGKMWRFKSPSHHF